MVMPAWDENGPPEYNPQAAVDTARQQALTVQQQSKPKPTGSNTNTVLQVPRPWSAITVDTSSPQGVGEASNYLSVDWQYNMTPTDAMASYDLLNQGGGDPLNTEALTVAIAKAMGHGKTPGGVFDDAVKAAAVSTENGTRMSVAEALLGLAGKYGVTGGNGPDSSGGGSRSGGGGGGGPVIDRVVNLTDPGTARTLLDQSLSQYLGRKASVDEIEKFTKALTRKEMANANTADVVGTTQINRGGFNAAAFADRFASRQEGVPEYQAATSLLDTFIGSLQNPNEVV